MLRVQKVRLYPNETMKQVLDDLCDYRRYCWNQGLALWNDMYDVSLILGDKKLRPSARKVRDELVANKEDWQYQLSARCLQLAISDLGKAWQNFFKKSLPDWGKPKFKSKKTARQGFKTDRAQIVDGKLRLDKPHGVKDWADISFKGADDLKGKLKVVSIYRENGKYWASLPFDVDVGFGAQPVVLVAGGQLDRGDHRLAARLGVAALGRLHDGVGGDGGAGNAVDLGGTGFQQLLAQLVGGGRAVGGGLAGGVHHHVGDGGLREGHGDLDGGGNALGRALVGAGDVGSPCRRCAARRRSAGHRRAGRLAGRQRAGGDTAHGRRCRDLEESFAGDLVHLLLLPFSLHMCVHMPGAFRVRTQRQKTRAARSAQVFCSFL